jgi:hypothetical protein
MTESVQWYGDEWMRRIRIGAQQGVLEGLSIVEERAIYLLTHPPKSGRVYRRRGVEHQASAPGEAPASDTGTLLNARQSGLADQQDLFDVVGNLAFTSKHAPFLEHGTRDMEPRPFALRSLVETKDQVKVAIGRNVAASLARP